MENRNGLIVDTQVREANGTAEREAALAMLEQIAGEQQITVGGDKNYDTKDFVAACRNLHVTPHVSQNDRRRGGSAIDGRTTRHAGYAISQRKRKRIEECFGWMKTIALLRKLRHFESGLDLHLCRRSLQFSAAAGIWIEQQFQQGNFRAEVCLEGLQNTSKQARMGFSGVFIAKKLKSNQGSHDKAHFFSSLLDWIEIQRPEHTVKYDQLANRTDWRGLPILDAYQGLLASVPVNTQGAALLKQVASQIQHRYIDSQLALA